MDARKFEIDGIVIDENTKAGISSLKVEAWDKDVKYDDLVGVAFTGRDGSFTIKFDQTYFREYARDDQPDLYFKVYRGEKLLKSTKDSVIVNASTKEQVTITLNLYHGQTEGTDRVSPKLAFNTYNFIRRSDFKGLTTEAKNKTSNVMTFIGDMIAGSLNDLKPIKVGTVKEDTIVGKDTNTVQADLSSKNITVGKVMPYDPKLNSNSFKQITGYPVRLQPGEKVNLYEKDGKVRYYSVVKEQSSTKDIQALKDELSSTKAQVTEKDNKIRDLQKQLTTLKKEQDTIRKQMGTDSVSNLRTEFEAMKKQLANLSTSTKAATTTKKRSTTTKSSGKGTTGKTDSKK